MTNFIHSLFSLARHSLLEIDEHSLHSPFMFHLYTQVIKPSRQYPVDEEIEKLRSVFLHSDQKIRGRYFGAGSRKGIPGKKSLRGIAKYSATPSKYSNLMISLIRHFGCREILELGTSLGFNSMYLARAGADCRVYTFEGNERLAALSGDNFRSLGCTNIETLGNDIHESLPAFLAQNRPVDFIYLDADHTFEGTIWYINLLREHFHGGSVVVIDDIHWSAGMTRAWNRIYSQNPGWLFLDLFRCGIILPGTDTPAGYYRLVY